MLIFQLTYKLNYKSKDTFYINLGWLPYIFIDNPNYGYTIKDNLITGPGKNLFNESIFEI